MHPNTVVENTPTKLKQPITVSGTVLHGQKLGRTIGFPTANLDISATTAATLEPGVYFGHCTIENTDTQFNCLPYFGPRYILDEVHDVFEVFIYDFNEEIYENTLHVRLTHFIRGPLQIHSLKHLKEQLTQDKKVGTTLRRNQTTI